MPSSQNRYSSVAIALHWLIAIAIILQLASGLWMTDAIAVKESQAFAYKVYQWHKAVGLLVLVLSVVRLGWRLKHPAPALPEGMKAWEKLAAKLTHIIFYILMITIPFLGWAMVSVSAYGLPTIIFGWFEWPHLPILSTLENKVSLEEWFKNSHELSAKLMMLLLALHIGAALKHHFINKDNVLARMLPFLRRKKT